MLIPLYAASVYDGQEADTVHIQQAPNFHKYLQSEILGTASDAVLGEPADAAQFEITGGQLVQHASGECA